MNQGMRDEIKKLVEEAEAIAQEATAGPWCVDSSGSFFAVRVVGGDGAPGAQITGWDSRKRAPDLKFIAHARQDVPALCAEVRRLDAELKRFQIIAGTMTGYLQSLGFEVVTEQDGTVSIAPATPDAIAQ